MSGMRRRGGKAKKTPMRKAKAPEHHADSQSEEDGEMSDWPRAPHRGAALPCVIALLVLSVFKPGGKKPGKEKAASC